MIFFEKKLLEHKIENYQNGYTLERAMIGYNNNNLIAFIQIDNGKRAFISTKTFNIQTQRYGRWKLELDTEDMNEIEKIKSYIQNLKSAKEG